jgi:molybdopterin converting factor small subunit
LRVTVEVLAGIRPPRQERKASLELPDGSTVRDALLAYGFPTDQIRFLRVWRGDELADLNTKLKDGDAISVAIPLSGGLAP